MSRPPRIHTLRSNDAERSPSRLLVIDSEADISPDGDREVHQLALWCTRLLHRHGHERKRPRISDSWGRTHAELGDLVDQTARSQETLWVFCHNLSYDLILTRLPLLLGERGWILRKHNLASDTPWAHMSKGSKSIRLADSFSWLPQSLEQLGDAVGLGKLPLPEQGDSEEDWLARCRRDVEITALVLEQLMDEWDRRKLGWWSITGPATAWNSMLHLAPHRKPRHGRAPNARQQLAQATGPTQLPLIDPDPEAREFERRAIYSGRRDVWRWGQLPPSDFVELDFRLAHLTVCASIPLPDRRGRFFSELPIDAPEIGSRVRSILAECVVQTETPRYPLRWSGAVLHPVGRFRTVLCGPEIAEARARGELVSVGPGYVYRLGVHMQPWAQWALGMLTGPPESCPPALRVFLKGASRTVPGRWGMQVSREALSGPSHVRTWALERSAFGRPARPGAILHMAGRWTEVIRDQEPDDSFPAVLAHIQAWDRLLLQRALDVLGPDATLQCNTDSVLCHGLRLQELAWEHDLSSPEDPDQGAQYDQGARALSIYTAPLEIRVKQWDVRAVILSPQHVRLGDVRKYSGVPRGAQETERETFEFWTWPKMAGQLEGGDQGGYVRERRKVRLGKVPINRWAYTDGCAEPVRAAVDSSGTTELLPPGLDWCRLHGAPRREVQHPILRGLL